MNDLTSALKDRAILCGWIAGLVLIAALLWSLSFPFRSVCLMNSVNKTLAAMDDPRRLSSALPYNFAGTRLRSADPLGCWYRSENPSADTNNSLFFVFTIIREGILVPCGAEISEEGKITQIIPLGNHARQVMDQIPHGMIQVYIHRIESAARRYNR